MKFLGIIFALAFFSSAQAKLRVVTTTSTLESLVKYLGQDKLEVSSLSRVTQDPHFVEAKPSYMVRMRRADLLVSVGLDLEVGWLGNVQRGAKNPNLLEGGKGFFAAGDHIKAIEVPSGKVDRSLGDVHPLGNPHFQFDPLRVSLVVKALADKLGSLDTENSQLYQDRAKAFETKVNKEMPIWRARIEKSKIKELITYHKSFNYFLNLFNIVALDTIEPKPGVPPTAKHIISLISLAKAKHVRCILNESYFETNAAQRIQQDTKAITKIVPVEIAGDYFRLIETIVEAVEACGKGEKK